MAQALLAVGVNYEQTRSGRSREVRLTRCDSAPGAPSPPSPPSQTVTQHDSSGDGRGDSSDDRPAARHHYRTGDVAAEQVQQGAGDSSDGSDDPFSVPFDGELFRDSAPVCADCGRSDRPSGDGRYCVRCEF